MPCADRRPPCPALRLAALIDQAIEAGRVAATNGSLEFVETPPGRYWIPQRNHDVMAEMMVSPATQLAYRPCLCVETEFVRRLQPEVLMAHI
jgi:hypothetical protein